MEQEIEKKAHSSFWSNIFKKNIDEESLIEVLRDMPPFSLIPKSLIMQIISLMHSRQYIANEIIFHQDDPGIGLYIINEGTVTVEYISSDGVKIKLADFKPGDFFGELALVDGETRSATARAKSDCKISVLFKPDFDSLLERHPREGLQIMQGISKIIITRLRRLNTDYFALYDSYLQLKEQKNGTQH